MNKIDLQRLDIRYFAVAVSLLISLLERMSPSTLNDDSYAYVRTAEVFLADGIQAAVSHYSWPIFSILIALVSKLGLTLFSSAFLINSLFFALLTFALLSIIKTIDSDRSTLVLAAICVLVYPELNEYRGTIIRDVAFWSLVFLSLWQLILYTQHQSLTNNIGFTACLIMAAAFRAEALAYLFVIPLLHIIFTSSKGLRNSYLKLLFSSCIILLCLTLFLLLLQVNVATQLVKFVSVYRPFMESPIGSDPESIASVSVAVFGDYAAIYSEDYLGLFIAGGLFSLLIFKILNGVGAPLFLLLAAQATKQRAKIDSSILLSFYSYFFVNFIIIFVFIFITRYLPSRHTMILSLILLIFLSLLAKELLNFSRQAETSLIRGSLYLLLVYCTIDSYYSFGYKKEFIANSNQWLKQNSPLSQRLLTNNHAIAFASKKIENYDKVSANVSTEEILNVGNDALLVIEMNLTMATLMRELVEEGAIEFEIGFPAGPEPRVAIYRTMKD